MASLLPVKTSLKAHCGNRPRRLCPKNPDREKLLKYGSCLLRMMKYLTVIRTPIYRPHWTARLQKRLFYIYQDSQSILEELGYSTLYLALTFLEWTESEEAKETHLAPLILLPVEMERAGVRSAFKMRWNNEDIAANISLKETLSRQDIFLPDFEMPEEKSGLNLYLQEVEKAIRSRSRWHIKTDICLGFFSFTRFIMYKDLDPQSWSEKKSPVNHPLIRSLFGTENAGIDDKGFQEDEVDRKLDSRDLYHVFDADSSQIAVIEDVKSGHNLAVEGPPGTGKSQTIVNTIAELLAAGKSVLFVSEKMAALQVVKSRLDEIGLGNFCLELHSRKSNKKEFRTNLERALSTLRESRDLPAGEYNKLEILKKDLNKYATALKEPFGRAQLTPVQLFHLKDKARRFFEQLPKEIPRVILENTGLCDNTAYEEAKRKLSELQGILTLIAPFAKNPWQGCAPDPSCLRRRKPSRICSGSVLTG